MAYRMAPVLVTLNDLEGHSPIVGLFKCNPSKICAVFYQISTDTRSRGPSATAGLLVLFDSVFAHVKRNKINGNKVVKTSLRLKLYVINILRSQRDRGTINVNTNPQATVVLPFAVAVDSMSFRRRKRRRRNFHKQYTAMLSYLVTRKDRNIFRRRAYRFTTIGALSLVML